MPITNRIIANTQAFDFGSYPIQTTIGAGFTYTAVWNATSQGSIIGNSGYRVWDTAVRPANGSVLVTPTQPWTAPLTNSFLPPTYWDAVIDLNIDGQAIPLAFTNSPDNFAAYDGDITLTDTGNLYWVNLLRCKANATPSGSQSNLNYYFGADALQYSGAGVPNVLKLNLYEAVAPNTTVTFTYLMEYISTNGQVLGPWTGSVGVNRASGTRNITLGGFPAGMSTNPEGYMRISVTTQGGGAYRSLLPFYHWGLES